MMEMIIVDDFKLLKVLGKCPFGEVYLAQKSNSNELFMAKRIKRQIPEDKNSYEYIEKEINILNSLNHPNIIKLITTKKTKHNFYVIFEYINGYNLSDSLHKYMQKYNKAFSELIIQHLMRQIIEALIYIHEKKIIHTNLNINNIMVGFDSQDDKENLNMMNAKIKIMEFGFAVDLEELRIRELLLDPIGFSPLFNHSYQEDITLLGIVCYELITGKPAFDEKTLKNLRTIDYFVPFYKKLSIPSIPSIPSSIPVSSEFASFLNDMSHNVTTNGLLKHPFLSKNIYCYYKTNANNSISLNKQNIEDNNEDVFSITSLNPGERIITVNFLTLGNQDIGHYSIAGKNTNRFSLLLKKFYKDYPAYRNKKLKFMFNAKIIDNIEQTLEEIGIKYNSRISIIEIES